MRPVLCRSVPNPTAPRTRRSGRRTRPAAFAPLALAVSLFPAIATGAPKLPYRYAAFELGTLSPNYAQNDIDHWAVNDRGMVLGLHRLLTGSLPPKDGGAYVWVDQNGNRLPDESYTDPASPGAPVVELRPVGVPAGQPAARLMDMNGAGVAVGALYDGATSMHAAKWTPAMDRWPPEAGSPTVLAGSGGVSGMRINEAGAVLDRFARALWRPDGTRVDLGAQFELDAPGRFLTTILDLAESERLLVSFQKLDPDGELRNYFHLWTPGNAPQQTPFIGGSWGALNSRGQYAARTLQEVEVSPGVFQWVDAVAVRDDTRGTTHHLTTPVSWLDLNEHGMLAGWRYVSGPTDTLPYVWHASHGLQDLNQLVEGDGVRFTHAVALNNFGEIVALGKETAVPNAPKKAYLLRPILGLDRWWATAGSAEPFVLHWTARFGEAGDADAEVVTQVLMAGTGWTLGPDATIEMLGSGVAPSRALPLAHGIACRWGTLPPGTYTFRISGVRVPATPQVGGAQFWSTFDGRRTKLVADMVADLPDDGAAFDAVVAQYAPVLHMNPGDEPGPARVEMTWGPEGAPLDACPSWALGAPVTGDVSGQLDLSRFIPAALAANWPLPPTPSPRARTWKVALPPDVATIYASVVHREPELAVNYYFHYRRNDWRDYGGYNNHEGDWEGITVFLRRPTPVDAWVPDRVAYSQHVRVGGFGGGQVVPWDPAWTRPHVYVGLGGHASYPQAGTTCLSVFSISDPVRPEVHEGGVVLDAARVVRLPRVGELEPGPGPWQWLVFPGKWGRVTGVAGGDGPHGPVFLERTLEILSTDPVGRRWLDPWAWAASLGGASSDLCFLEDFETFADWATFGAVGWVFGTGDEADDREIELAGPDDAAIERTFSIPTTGHSAAQFTFRVLSAEPGDRLALRMAGHELWSADAVDHLADGYVQTLPIPLTSFAGQTAALELRLVSGGGSEARVRIDDLSLQSTPEDPLGVPGEAGVPGRLEAGSRPNPFRDLSRIRFRLGTRTRVSLEVFDIAGRSVRRMLGGVPFEPGEHSVDWDGRDSAGRGVAPGVYLARLDAGDERTTLRLHLLR
jgi:hypothetical protein